MNLFIHIYLILDMYLNFNCIDCHCTVQHQTVVSITRPMRPILLTEAQR